MSPVKRRSHHKDVNAFVFILVVLFACSSWIDYYAMNVELPIFVTVLPEGWTLPSNIYVIIMVANLAPIIYISCGALFKNVDKKKKENVAVYVIIGTGAVASFLLAFVWDHTAYLFGQERSVALLTLILFLSVVDCTSCVVFFPFMARFPSSYMSGYIAGEEIGGLIVGLVGLAQGASGDPLCSNDTQVIFNETVTSVSVSYRPLRFSVFVYFIILVGMMLLSLVAFLLLNFANCCTKHMVSTQSEADLVSQTKEMMGQGDQLKDATDNGLYDQKEKNWTQSQKFRTFMLTFQFGWIACILYGYLPSIQPYAALPFGNLAYTLSVRLATIANPLACLSTLFLQTRSLRVFSALISLGTVLATVATVFATMSPEPPLVNHVLGTPLVVMMFVMLTMLFSFTRTSIAAELHRESGHSGLLLAGAVTLIGMSIGTIVAFILINVAHVFIDKPPCA